VENEGSVLDELQWRGLVALSTDEAALREHLDAGPITFYVGFDPTAPSLHFGNLVQLIVAGICSGPDTVRCCWWAAQPA
jgi:tyrosyl-tRNA synthetase